MSVKHRGGRQRIMIFKEIYWTWNATQISHSKRWRFPYLPYYNCVYRSFSNRADTGNRPVSCPQVNKKSWIQKVKHKKKCLLCNYFKCWWCKQLFYNWDLPMTKHPPLESLFRSSNSSITPPDFCSMLSLSRADASQPPLTPAIDSFSVGIGRAGNSTLRWVWVEGRTVLMRQNRDRDSLWQMEDTTQVQSQHPASSSVSLSQSDVTELPLSICRLGEILHCTFLFFSIICSWLKFCKTFSMWIHIHFHILWYHWIKSSATNCL